MKKVMKKIHEYEVTFYLYGKKVETRRYNETKDGLWKKIKNWPAEQREKDWNSAPRFEINEVVHHKPITSLFLSQDLRKELNGLIADAKKVYASITDEFKKKMFRNMCEHVWAQMQNEFYHTANISKEQLFAFQDLIVDFDDWYLTFNREPAQLDDWSKLLKEWTCRTWAVEVLKLIRDFNLDSQPRDYVLAFQSDFMKVQSNKQFCATLLKWNDFIYWNPEKLSLLDSTFCQPVSVHFEGDENPDVGESARCGFDDVTLDEQYVDSDAYLD